MIVHEQSESERVHDIEIAKGLLKAMFAKDPGKPMRSPMDFFGGRVRARDRPELKLKRSSGNPSTQYVATATRRSQVKPSIPIDERYGDGRLFARLAELPEQHIVFIRAIYMRPGPEQFGYQERAAALLRDAYLDTIDKRLRARTKHIIGKMSEVQLECMCTPSFAVAMTVKPWKQFEVPADSWRQSYSQHWQYVLWLVRYMKMQPLIFICNVYYYIRLNQQLISHF